MKLQLNGKKILLGVTGSIAAYKTPMLIREFVKLGAEVKVIMTPSAKEFVTPISLASVSKSNVVYDMFDLNSQKEGAWHIHLAHWCDIALIAPCSATTLGKLASGIADNALVAVTMAIPRHIPLLIAPAMDTTMYEYPATQKNIKLLESYGAVIIPPATGELASGLSGPGRLAEFSDIINFVDDNLNSNRSLNNLNFEKNIQETENNTSTKSEKSPKEENFISEERKRELTDKPLETLDEAIEKDKFNSELNFSILKNKMAEKELHNFFKEKKILITAGPTQEKIDSVRYISNYSSGKMGFALAEAANEFGAEVTLVSGPVNLSCNQSINRIDVVTAKEMYEQVMLEPDKIDIFIMAAAVADFQPKNYSENKIKKETLGENYSIELIKTRDILSEIGKIKKDNQILVGFALESENEIEYGKNKLENKNADIIVINSMKIKDSTFGSDFNQITIIDKKNNLENYDKATKQEVAKIILEYIRKFNFN